jgi:hypothetical protein
MNLIEAIQQQQTRFRDELIPAYEEIGTAGQFALQLTLKPLLTASEQAIASGDAVDMIRVLQQMRDVKE